MIFEIELTEVLQKTVFINACCEDEAYMTAESMYGKGEIVLSADDFVSTNIEVLEDDGYEEIDS